MQGKLKHFVLDVDGVLNTGQFLYTEDGKFAKIFGAHDNDGLKMIQDMVQIQFISADKRGWDITYARVVDDMGFPLSYVPEADREEFIKRLGFEQTVYMGDGYYDAPIMKKCALSIAPASARIEALEAATYVTPSKAAEGAVLDACLWLKEKLYE